MKNLFKLLFVGTWYGTSKSWLWLWVCYFIATFTIDAITHDLVVLVKDFIILSTIILVIQLNNLLRLKDCEIEYHKEYINACENLIDFYRKTFQELKDKVEENGNDEV